MLSTRPRVLATLRDPAHKDEVLQITHRLIVRTSKNQYEETLGIAKEWAKKKPDYELFKNNCKDFTHSVAKKLEIAPKLDPKMFEWPEDYLARMIEEGIKAKKK